MPAVLVARHPVHRRELLAKASIRRAARAPEIQPLEGDIGRVGVLARRE